MQNHNTGLTVRELQFIEFTKIWAKRGYFYYSCSFISLLMTIFGLYKGIVMEQAFGYIISLVSFSAGFTFFLQFLMVKRINGILEKFQKQILVLEDQQRGELLTER